MRFQLLLLVSTVILLCLASAGAQAQWIQTTGPSGTECFLGTGTDLFAGTQGGLFLSTNDGLRWNPIGPAGFDSNWFTSIVQFGGKIFVSTLNSGIFVSSDMGVNWMADSLGVSGSTTLDVGEIVSSNTNIITGTNVGVFTSTDSGVSWQKTLDVPTMKPMLADGKNVYGLVNLDTTFYYSSDAGLTWEKRGYFIGQIYSMVNVHGDIFAAMSNGAGFYLSTDQGNTWATADGDLIVENFPRFNAHFAYTYGDDVFIGSDFGVFLTTNEGLNWQDVTDSAVQPEDGHILDIDGIIAWNGNLFVGADDSVWYRPLSQMLPNDSVSASPTPTAGIAVYPDPIAQSASMNVTLEKSAVADISIVNMLGEEVANIFNGALSEGTHSLVWRRPSSLRAGAYECVLRLNGTSQQIPIILEQ